MKIGSFTEQGAGYAGSISTAGLSVVDVTFSPIPVKQGSGPDFVVLGMAGGDEFELGAAWAKTSKKGKGYLSVKIDGPVLAAPINCALTKQADGSHALVWKRSKGEDDAEAEEQIAA
jgi:uncharacterized protein (DUF736 family)